MITSKFALIFYGHCLVILVRGSDLLFRLLIHLYFGLNVRLFVLERERIKREKERMYKKNALIRFFKPRTSSVFI